MRRTLLAAAVLLSGCNSVTLTDLKCAGDCQVSEDPFRLQLTAAYDDPSRALAGARVKVSVDHRDVATLDADAVATPPGALKGTLAIEVPLKFGKVTDGQQFQVDVRTEGPAGSSNFVSGTFKVKL
jgi:hypothetical protein